MDGCALREIVLARIFAGVVGDDRKPLRPLGPYLMGDLGDAEAAFGRLPSGHRDRVVVEDLVGDVHARRGGGAQRQQTRMGVSPVTQILEDMGLVREWRL